MKAIRELQRRTGLTLVECRRALAAAAGSIDGALQLLRAQGAVRSKSFDDLARDIAALAEGWAREFLEATRETGELAEYLAQAAIRLFMGA